MKKTFIICLALLSLNLSAQKIISAGSLKLSIDENLRINSIYGSKEYLPEGVDSYLLRLQSGENELFPQSAEWKNNNIRVSFDKDIEIILSMSEFDEYLRIEVIETNNDERIDILFYGPFPTTINETVGEIVGVVREDGYAVGIQSLNAKTTGGKYINPDGSDEARGTAATVEEYGSSLQAYCINRDKDREYAIWNNRIPDAFIPANPDGNLEGSAIALFGCTEKDVLNIVEKIEIEQGLPHSTLNGKWSKTSPDANKPYLITTFTEDNIDEMIEFTKRLGYNTIYHSHPFSTWGHFDLIEDQFPNGWDGMKVCVEKARAEGIRLGAHTLTNFITTNDPFVTPVPDKDLMIFCRTVLTRDVSDSDTEIYIANPAGYDYQNANQALILGEEIIRFSGVSETEPYKLLDCKRGQYGTTVSSYNAGDEIARLADHDYKVFFPNWELQKEMISNLADFFNYTGVGQLDFDGHEGGWGTGEGEFGMDYFSEQLQKQVNHELRNGSSRSNHYYWHTVSYINWGEPWYGGFTKSQGHYRYRNQELLRRNYIPNMLGWFLLNESTTLQEVEYMLARSAGYDAGYALYSMLNDMKKNTEFESVAEAIKIWEEARLKKIFNEEQMEQLRDVNNDFSLTRPSANEYLLQYYEKEHFELHDMPVQPGQPNDVSMDFEAGEEQPFYLVVGAVGDSGTISNIILDFNGYTTHAVNVELKPNWSITYRGDDKILVYDDVGRLKTRVDFDEDSIMLKKGHNNIRLSADFKAGSDIKLQGYIRLKGKSERIKN
ncbi:MAG TPA: hypothetical protein ENH59_11355 [Bacteroidetes bacterium]|nr:hypothetical protein [Bacteroidota bacterium]